MLCKKDGDPNALFEMYPSFDPLGCPPDVCGWTFLELACLEKDLHVVRGLVACGATLQHHHSCQMSSLHLACDYKMSDALRYRTRRAKAKQFELVTWILSQDEGAATINARSNNHISLTPLHLVLEHENTALIKLLLEHGADLALRTVGGETALDIVQRGQSTRNAALLQEASQRTQTMTNVSWRPWTAHSFPPGYRVAMRTIVSLAKCVAQA
jgi:ankyrin repeat protein